MRALLLVALTACVVMRPPHIDERPRWRLAQEAQLDVGCAIVRPLVRKSGKQGIGMTLQIRTRGDCTVAFTQATLVFPDGTALALAPPPPHALPGRSLDYQWWPIELDNNAAWNAGRRSGELVLAYRIGDATGTWQLAMEER